MGTGGRVARGPGAPCRGGGRAAEGSMAYGEESGFCGSHCSSTLRAVK